MNLADLQKMMDPHAQVWRTKKQNFEEEQKRIETDQEFGHDPSGLPSHLPGAAATVLFAGAVAETDLKRAPGFGPWSLIYAPQNVS